VDTRPDGSTFCKICGIDFKRWKSHANTRRHKEKILTVKGMP
jgi:hypothetical protein